MLASHFYLFKEKQGRNKEYASITLPLQACRTHWKALCIENILYTLDIFLSKTSHEI